MTPNLQNTDNRHASQPQVRLKWWQVAQLEKQGCSADSWDSVTVSPLLDLRNIRNVHFGDNVSVGSGVVIRNVPGGIRNCFIGDNAIIENVARIEFEPEAACGVGISICALDEIVDYSSVHQRPGSLDCHFRPYAYVQDSSAVADNSSLSDSRRHAF